jgi:hypothetical protein
MSQRYCLGAKKTPILHPKGSRNPTLKPCRERTTVSPAWALTSGDLEPFIYSIYKIWGNLEKKNQKFFFIFEEKKKFFLVVKNTVF